MEINKKDDVYETLINLVGRHPAIYDKSSKEYKNSVLNRQAWEEIASDIYLASGKETTVEEVKNEWRKLKTRYQSERTKLNAYIPSGSGLSTEKLDSDWHYYKLMGCLYKYPANLDGCESGSYSKPVDKTKGNSFNEISVPSKTKTDDIDSLISDEDIEETSYVSTAYPRNLEQFAELQNENDYFLSIQKTWNRVPEDKEIECYRTVMKIIEKKISERKQ